MTRFCLDTSAYIRHRQGHAAMGEVISRASSVLMPVITLGELRAGFRRGSKSQKNEDALGEFMSEPIVSIVDLADSTTWFYADLAAALKRAGTPLPTNDIWIAALALEHGATVVTFDNHFGQMPGVGAIILPI